MYERQIVSALLLQIIANERLPLVVADERQKYYAFVGIQVMICT